VSGIILHDETFWQSDDDGIPFRIKLTERGVIPGIKVDEGLADLPGFPGESVSRGLDGLPARLEKYRAAGAAFAKWRSVIVIGDGLPTDEAIGANTHVLARYARLCQEYDIVPIVEPEVLYDGTHAAERTEEVIAHVYDTLFTTMRAYRVHLPGAVLKTSMVIQGKDSGVPIVPEDVGMRTSLVFHGHIPADLGGVVFLSGGQTPDNAFANLAAIARRGPYPFGVTFSYSRAIQDPVLRYFAAHRDDRVGVENIYLDQLDRAVHASRGENVGVSGDGFVTASQDG
jgi:fructose-bisphosphate aldolase class I